MNMQHIPSFSEPTEIRLALQIGGRALKLESAKKFSEKLKAAKDMKTFIESFRCALKGYKFSEEFTTYINNLMSEVKTVLGGAKSWMK
jgi:2-keto-3-deoxy-6-phosphogluconate aldolase